MKTKIFVSLTVIGCVAAMADTVVVNFTNTPGIQGFGATPVGSLTQLTGYADSNVTDTTSNKTICNPTGACAHNTLPANAVTMSLGSVVFNSAGDDGTSLFTGTLVYHVTGINVPGAFTGSGTNVALTFEPTSGSGVNWQGNFTVHEVGTVSGTLSSLVATALGIQPVVTGGTINFVFNGALVLNANTGLGTDTIKSISAANGTISGDASIVNFKAASLTPEPTTVSLLGLGLAAGALVLKRRRA